MFAVEVGMHLKWECECRTKWDVSEARFRAVASHCIAIIWIAPALIHSRRCFDLTTRQVA
ncbi:hypothetical protein SBC1_22630 [Caballeronia sp. SBC1]|nr:hypothetical protein SBC2_24040 [Caballeronia sp. SBC2]QIN62257.1 hypothetical protein SBC1_22630 [Caballeronia sp. SBC1]